MKFRLALYNVVFSQLFIMSFLFFAYFIWFPHSLVELSEFKRLAITLTLVNLILGPLLVIFINKKGKKKVKFDLIVLFLVQISAICFGSTQSLSKDLSMRFLLWTDLHLLMPKVPYLKNRALENLIYHLFPAPN